MQKIYFYVMSLGITLLVQAEDVPHFYQKAYRMPISSYEQFLIEHTANSFIQAVQKKSKIDNPEFESDRSCNSVYGVIPYYHLLNNLCSLKDASHLHIGLYTGGSFVSALYANEELLIGQIGIDWFEADWYRNTCYDVCKKYLQKDHYRIISSDCFAIDKSIFKRPIDVYVYDADHSIIAHEMAFTYYNDVLADVFIAVVDDWALEQVRQGTFQAFDKLGYQILYENEILDHETIGNGQYIAVIRKK